SVIANQEPESVGEVLEDHVDRACIGVTQGVGNGFAPDEIHLGAGGRLERPRLTFDHHGELCRRLNPKVTGNCCDRVLEVVCIEIPCTQAPNSGASLLHELSQEARYVLEEWSGFGGRRDLILYDR